MITCHVNLNLVFDWLIDCFGPGYQANLITVPDCEKHQDIKMTDLFPGSSYATTTEANRIYINENLTSFAGES